jgi:hypothetical protein
MGGGRLCNTTGSLAFRRPASRLSTDLGKVNLWKVARSSGSTSPAKQGFLRAVSPDQLFSPRGPRGASRGCDKGGGVCPRTLRQIPTGQRPCSN